MEWINNDEGQIILCPLTAFATAAANGHVLLALDFFPDAEAMEKRQTRRVQIAMTTEQAKALAAALTGKPVQSHSDQNVSH